MRYFTSFIALLIASSAASAASYDPPRRKSGLWEVKVSSAQAKGAHTIQQCVDQKTDDLVTSDMGGGEKMSCSKSEFRKDGDRIVHDSICKIEGSTAKTRTVISGRFDSAYKIESKSTYEPPMAGMRESTTVMDAKWLGACKAGQKAGDVSIPGMPNINMDELMKNMPQKR